MSTATVPTARARLDALARPDKWYLSCGDSVIWAPSFPAWLHVPGFWDEAHLDDLAVAPLFSVAVVDRSGRPVPLTRQACLWRPDRLEVEWRSSLGTTIVETRRADPGGWMRSEWRCPTPAEPSVLEGAWLVGFTIQPGDAVADLEPAGANALEWCRAIPDRRAADALVAMRLEVMSARVARRAAVRSEGTVAQPIWLHTPFAERWASDGLEEDIRLEGLSPRGFVHAAVAVPLDFDGTTTFGLRLSAGSAADAPRDDRHQPASEAAQTWERHFESFPVFRCSDAYLSRYYDYRLYGLHLNRLAGGRGHVRFPCIAEGTAYFHVPIAYSAQCHMWETRWAHASDLAFGSLRNFIVSQRADGGFHGRLYARHLVGTDFYHANWGDAARAALALHDDASFEREAYEGLSRYAEWLTTTRDAEGSGLIDVIDQFETGQEYMSRYLAVDPEADRYGWENRIRLKGIDVSVYAYQLFRFLATTASRLSDVEGCRRWDAARELTGDAIRSRCWDETAGLFMDVVPGTWQRTGVKAAVGFYPLLTDLVDERQLARLVDHLARPDTFGTPWPLPSSSVDDRLFSARAEWKGKRHVCPWNGRVWPMTTSHVLEGLLRQWHGGRRSVGALAADLLRRYVRLFFDRGDLGRPTSYEHYNPLTGDAAFYRGIDDYMHSWVLDLLIRGVAGLEPTQQGLRIDPLPLDLEDVSLENAIVRGHRVSIRRRGGWASVEVDGRSFAARQGDPLEVDW
ncbi:MAG: trehalase family glycosidase [Vicinamibacterales bacterium]